MKQDETLIVELFVIEQLDAVVRDSSKSMIQMQVHISKAIINMDVFFFL